MTAMRLHPAAAHPQVALVAHWAEMQLTRASPFERSLAE
jgi:hypothetical protein